MNKKGQNEMGMIAVFIGIFVAVIVGIALFQASAQQVGEASDLFTLENVSMPSAAVAGEAQYLTDFKSISGLVVFNATNDVEVPSSNYTATNNVIDPTTGGLSVNITPIVTGLNNTWAAGTWTVDGTGQTPEYISDSGARAVARLIIIFFALAIAVVTIIPTLRSKVLGM
jgi:hypothetical protein